MYNCTFGNIIIMIIIIANREVVQNESIACKCIYHKDYNQQSVVKMQLPFRVKW